MKIEKAPPLPSEDEILKFIRRGGSSPVTESTSKKKVRTFHLEIPEELFEQMEQKRKKDLIEMPRRQWILQAIKKAL